MAWKKDMNDSDIHLTVERTCRSFARSLFLSVIRSLSTCLIYLSHRIYLLYSINLYIFYSVFKIFYLVLLF